MGIGDSIMATAEARHYYDLYGHRVVFAKPGAKPYYDEIFYHNHKIAQTPKDGERVVRVENYPGKRPYIIGADSKRVYWNRDFQIEPGEVFLTKEEIRRGEVAKGKIIVCTTTKDNQVSKNKQWPHWLAFTEMAKDLPLVRLSGNPGDSLPMLETPTFRDALAMLYHADLVITTDGALHHAAAALGTPAIVIWGGLITPDILGYDSQINLWNGAEACGSLQPCEHCRNALTAITPDEVLHAALAARNASLDTPASDALA